MSVVVRGSGRTRRSGLLSALRREEIIRAATRLFGRKGYDATRAEDIATAAKIAKGTLYLYFKSKEAIYAAAVAQACTDLQAEVEQQTAAAAGFEQKLSTAIRVRLEFWLTHEAIYRLLLTVGSAAPHRRQTNELLRLGQRSFLAIFAEGVAAGDTADVDYAPLAWATLDMVRGASQRRVDRLCERTPQQDAAWITAGVLALVQSGPGTAPTR